MKHVLTLKISGDRNRWTWLTRTKINDEIFHDLLHHRLPLPVLELWHFNAGQECWSDISKSLQIEGSITQKLVLNDVFLSEEIMEKVTECCVSVRLLLISFVKYFKMTFRLIDKT